MLVAIDANPLAYAMRPDDDSDLAKRSRWLFSRLEADRAQIVVPSVVVAEFLAGIDPERHARVLARLSKLFIVAPFDIRCASIAAELFWKGKDQRPANEAGGRDVLKADTLIVATAKSYGARVFYTHDDRCRKLAATVMTAYDLPVVGNNLFDA